MRQHPTPPTDAHAPPNAAPPPPIGPGQLSELDADAFLRLSQIVPTLFPVNRATWWGWCKSGHAPAPVKLGPGVTVWRVGDLRAFIATQQAEAAAKTGRFPKSETDRNGRAGAGEVAQAVAS